MPTGWQRNRQGCVATAVLLLPATSPYRAVVKPPAMPMVMTLHNFNTSYIIIP